MKNFKLIGLVLAINLICFFIPREYYQYLTIQSNGTDALLTIGQCFTYIFMSENIFHLVLNGLFLVSMSRLIVFTIPDILFVAYYILWGVIVGIINYIIASHDTYHYLIGNSGVLYAFIGYSTVFSPNIEVKLFGSYKMSFLGFGIVIFSLPIISIVFGSNVYGDIAHISGFILGLITAKIYKKIHIWQTN